MHAFVRRTLQVVTLSGGLFLAGAAAASADTVLDAEASASDGVTATVEAISTDATTSDLAGTADATVGADSADATVLLGSTDAGGETTAGTADATVNGADETADATLVLGSTDAGGDTTTGTADATVGADSADASLVLGNTEGSAPTDSGTGEAGTSTGDTAVLSSGVTAGETGFAAGGGLAQAPTTVLSARAMPTSAETSGALQAGALARTGADAAVTALMGLLLLVAGAALMAGRRQHRHARR
ncbi:MAG: LPXTG cell wall anchor domain-containing protein [Actinomycetota bacterium]